MHKLLLKQIDKKLIRKTPNWTDTWMQWIGTGTTTGITSYNELVLSLDQTQNYTTIETLISERNRWRRARRTWAGTRQPDRSPLRRPPPVPSRRRSPASPVLPWSHGQLREPGEEEGREQQGARLCGRRHLLSLY